jgi:hypothetical protein
MTPAASRDFIPMVSDFRQAFPKQIGTIFAAIDMTGWPPARRSAPHASNRVTPRRFSSTGRDSTTA